MKPTKPYFKIFKEECQKWIDLLELNNWKVYYSNMGYSNDSMAMCKSDCSNYVATIFLNESWDDDIRPLNETEVRISAQHEVVHLLLERLSGTGHDREAKHSDITEAEEELDRKITHLITKLKKQ